MIRYTEIKRKGIGQRIGVDPTMCEYIENYSGLDTIAQPYQTDDIIVLHRP